LQPRVFLVMEFCSGGDLHDVGEKYACIEGFEND
jgi:hypothetical protein